MKKILGLTIAALLVMALVGGGSWAYFSDPEYSSNNILTAGTLDLSLNDGDADVQMLTAAIGDVQPGDSGSAFVTLEAGGTLAGELDIGIGAIGNTGAASGTSEYADDVGDLGGKATIAVWLDVNQNTTWDSGDIELEPAGADPFTSDAVLDGATIDSFGSVTWDDIYGGTFSGPHDFYIDWAIDGASVGNEIQGDSVSFDITFTLEQPEVDA